LEFSAGSTVNVSQALAGELQKIGIRLQVKVVTIDSWLANIGGPDLKRAPFFVSFGCTIPDAAAMPDFFLGTKNLQVGQYDTADYNPPDVNTLVNEGDATTAPAKRFAIY
jgi:ABC-type transport system substrate-binding protein